ncbi:MAG TPA: C4-dicarboxylate ABC transporter, partial [Rhodospirillaceae bacterium]|nr:C4-dicarboxylate ABC transporter [Rhodospirillaceae bacterium]
MFDDMGAVLAMLLFLTAFVVLLSGFPVAFALGGTAVIFAFLGMLSGDFVWGMMS